MFGEVLLWRPGVLQNHPVRLVYPRPQLVSMGLVHEEVHDEDMELGKRQSRNLCPSFCSLWMDLPRAQEQARRALALQACLWRTFGRGALPGASMGLASPLAARAGPPLGRENNLDLWDRSRRRGRGAGVGRSRIRKRASRAGGAQATTH